MAQSVRQSECALPTEIKSPHNEAMNLKDHPMVIVVPVLVACTGLAWTIGYNMSESRVKLLESQVATQRMASDLQLPQLLTDLREASKQLGMQLESSQRVAALQKQADEAIAHGAALEREISTEKERSGAIQARLAEAESVVKSFYSEREEFKLQEHHTKALLGDQLSVGLLSVYHDHVTVLYDNKEETIKIGAELTAVRQGKSCRLRLNETSTYPSDATFTFLVSK